MVKPRFLILTAMILAAAASRLLPHPPNFSPIAAIALFGGATFANRRTAFLVTLGAMLLSDALIGFHSQMPTVYLSLFLILGIGFTLRDRRSPLPIAGATVAGSLFFFAVTNFGVWLFDGLYPRTAEGLVACFVAAIPFLQQTFTGDALYSGLLFGGYALLERFFRSLQRPVTAAG